MYNLHIKKTSVHGSSAGIKSAFEPSGSSGRSLSWFLQHEVTRSISTSPWMGCQSIAGFSPVLICSFVPICTPGQREFTVRNDLSLLSKSITQFPWPQLEPGLFNLVTSTLTMRPPCLPHWFMCPQTSMTVLFRPPLTRTITQYELLILLCSNHLLKCIMLYNV